MRNMNFIGWDVGGAHLKVACLDMSGKVNFIEQYASPLWKGVDCLEELFPKTINELPESDNVHALTITAELADIFNSREEGVHSLINLFEKSLGKDVNLYALDNGLLNLDVARNKTEQIASANWHVSSSFAASTVGTGVFIDVGSTTTDIIPFHNNQLMNKGFDDQSRLRCDELVYTGVIRTSLMALANKVPFNGDWQNIAAEHFATTADVYRILSCLNEEDDLMDAADGKAKDIKGSMQRLARMVGADNDNSVDEQCWYQLAEFYREKQLQLISNALLRVISNLPNKNIKLVAAGTGRFLVKEIARRLNLSCIDFSSLCSSDAQFEHKCNVCAPAVAVAQLNRQLRLS